MTRVLIDVGHPAHVHLFRGLIQHLERGSHEVLVTARDKEVTHEMLAAFAIRFERVGKMVAGRSIYREWMGREVGVLRLARSFRPDILLGNLNPVSAHVAFLLRKPCISFADYEPFVVRRPVGHWLTRPFSQDILHPAFLRTSFGRKGVPIPTFKELAYLHPNHFSPDESVASSLCRNHSRYAILRFSGWGSHHDAVGGGMTLEEKRRLVDLLSPSMDVWISSEARLPSDLAKLEFPLPPSTFVDALAGADLVIVDSQAVALEAAMLGVPTLRHNRQFAQSGHDLGTIIACEQRFQLLLSLGTFSDVESAATRLADDSSAKRSWGRRRKEMLQEVVDLRGCLNWFVSNYPESRVVVRDQGDWWRAWL